MCRLSTPESPFAYLMKYKNILSERTKQTDRKYLSTCNVLKFKASMNQKQQSKLRKLCQLIRTINEKLDSL